MAGSCGRKNIAIPDGAAVARFAEREHERVEFSTYVQFVADEQLGRACGSRGLARRRPLSGPRRRRRCERIGRLVGSLGLRARRNDRRAARSARPSPARIGDFPPPDPVAFGDDRAERFAQLLRANMRHAAALRLDHVMSLTRLFRIPLGRAAADGAYVTTRSTRCLAPFSVKASARAASWWGEDLGNVPDGFRARMEEARILSYRLLTFEREPAGGTNRPKHIRASRWQRRARTTCRRWPAGPSDATSRRDATRTCFPWRPHACARRAPSGFRAFLGSARREADGLSVDDGHALLAAVERGRPKRRFAPLAVATYRYLARTPACLAFVQLDDAVVSFDQVNLPGTVLEHPNWQRKMSVERRSTRRAPDRPSRLPPHFERKGAAPIRTDPAA